MIGGIATYPNVVEDDGGDLLYHVVHLAVEIIGAEHVPVLLADVFDGMQRALHILRRLLLLKLSNKLRDQRRPLILNEALAHERDAFEQELCDLLVWAAHNQID